LLCSPITILPCAYDLDEVFEEMENSKQKDHIFEEELTIPEDEFVHSTEFKNYLEFKFKLKEIHTKIENKENVSDEELTKFIQLNPEFWLAYFTVGEYYFENNNFE